mgnify:CR=1 FL=1
MILNNYNRQNISNILIYINRKEILDWEDILSNEQAENQTVSDGERLNYFFKTQNVRYGKCLEPTMSCEAKAIKPHSIQNARVLDLLERRGHVVMPRLSTTSLGPNVEFQEIGRNHASTFTGLCADHDREIFRALDTQEFALENPEHLFLLAYRSVTRELHAVLEGAMKIQASYLWQVDKGLDPADTPSPAGMEATAHLMKSWETWKYRCEFFDKALLNQEWGVLRHRVIVFERQPPVLAVSSLFSFPKSEKEGDIGRCTLNVFPITEDQTVVIFSHTKPETKAAWRALKTILTTKKDKQKLELSKLIIRYVENFVLSPSHYDNWNEEKKKKIHSLFVRTLFDENAIEDDRDLLLF